MYNRKGAKQIETAIKNIARCLNPEINIDDHLDISCRIDPHCYLWDEDGNELTGDECYSREFNKWAENKSNEETLLDLNKFNNKLIKSLEDDYYDNPGTLTLFVETKSELGNSLKDAIFKILSAFDYEEIYNG